MMQKLMMLKILKNVLKRDVVVVVVELKISSVLAIFYVLNFFVKCLYHNALRITQILGGTLVACPLLLFLLRHFNKNVIVNKCFVIFSTDMISRSADEALRDYFNFLSE